jgi:zinc and cadmium transporter
LTPPATELTALLTVAGLTAGIGLASALVASAFLVLPERLRLRAIPHLVSFATGALLGAALIGLLPEAISIAGAARAPRIGLVMLAGLLLFFVLEKLVLWRHGHEDPDTEPAAADRHRTRATGPMILWGDALHNVLDGVVIAAAYLTVPRLGVATAIAVFAHELPTEIGNLGILLHSGMSRLRALLLNGLVSVAAVLGAVVACQALGAAQRSLPYALAFAAASLLYIAVADLIPGLHRQLDWRRSLEQFALILLGLCVIWYTQAAETAAASGLP